jgi:hypothetical protein
MILSLIGCAGKGERIDIAIPGKHTGARVSGPSPGTMRVAVLPFKDKRENQAHLGKRSHLWGGTSVFDLQTGTLPEATAQALVDFLVRQRWEATLAREASHDGADVTIAGTIQDLSIDATSYVVQTELTAKSTLLLEITNRSDGSVVHERLLGTADDWVFWFEPADAQALTTDLFEKNFQRFLGDIRVEGQTIRRR